MSTPRPPRSPPKTMTVAGGEAQCAVEKKEQHEAGGAESQGRGMKDGRGGHSSEGPASAQGCTTQEKEEGAPKGSKKGKKGAFKPYGEALGFNCVSRGARSAEEEMEKGDAAFRKMLFGPEKKKEVIVPPVVPDLKDDFPALPPVARKVIVNAPKAIKKKVDKTGVKGTLKEEDKKADVNDEKPRGRIVAQCTVPSKKQPEKTASSRVEAEKKAEKKRGDKKKEPLKPSAALNEKKKAEKKCAPESINRDKKKEGGKKSRIESKKPSEKSACSRGGAEKKVEKKKKRGSDKKKEQGAARKKTYKDTKKCASQNVNKDKKKEGGKNTRSDGRDVVPEEPFVSNNPFEGILELPTEDRGNDDYVHPKPQPSKKRRVGMKTGKKDAKDPRMAKLCTPAKRNEDLLDKLHLAIESKKVGRGAGKASITASTFIAAFLFLCMSKWKKGSKKGDSPEETSEQLKTEETRRRESAHSSRFDAASSSSQACAELSPGEVNAASASHPDRGCCCTEEGQQGGAEGEAKEADQDTTTAREPRSSSQSLKTSRQQSPYEKTAHSPPSHSMKAARHPPYENTAPRLSQASRARGLTAKSPTIGPRRSLYAAPEMTQDNAVPPAGDDAYTHHVASTGAVRPSRAHSPGPRSFYLASEMDMVNDEPPAGDAAYTRAVAPARSQEYTTMLDPTLRQEDSYSEQSPFTFQKTASRFTQTPAHWSYGQQQQAPSKNADSHGPGSLASRHDVIKTPDKSVISSSQETVTHPRKSQKESHRKSKHSESSTSSTASDNENKELAAVCGACGASRVPKCDSSSIPKTYLSPQEYEALLSEGDVKRVRLHRTIEQAILETINNGPFAKEIQEDDCRTEISDKMGELAIDDSFTVTTKHGAHYYYTHKTARNIQSIIYKKDTPTANGAVFFDPNRQIERSNHFMRTHEFSKDGRYFAFGFSHVESDMMSIQIRDEHGNKIGPEIIGCKYTRISWVHEPHGILYSKYAHYEGDSKNAVVHSVFFHKNSDESSADAIVFQINDPRLLLDASEPVKGFLVISAAMPSLPYNNLYYCRIHGRSDFPVTPIPLIDNLEAKYEFVDVSDDVMIVRTNKESPNFKLIKINLKDHSMVDLISELPTSILDFVHVIKGGRLAVGYIEDVKAALYIHDQSSGDRLYQIPIEKHSTITGFYADKDEEEIFFTLESHLVPLVEFKMKVRIDEMPALEVIRRVPMKGMEKESFKVEKVYYPSKDGTKIPMYIISNADMQKESPVILDGYCGYNMADMPSFSVSRLIFIRHYGGVVACANLRGGALYGEGRHRRTQDNLIDKQIADCIAAGEYLVKEKIADPEKLALMGHSYTGLVVDRISQRRPDLFQCVINRVGDVDLNRYQKFAVGGAGLPEYFMIEEDEQDNVEFNFLPLENILIDEESTWPPTLFMTADKVYPERTLLYIKTLYDKAVENGKQHKIMGRVEMKTRIGLAKPHATFMREILTIYSFMHVGLRLEWKH